MVMMAIRVGKRPLQGTKLLVMMAISRSLGLSMMRQPTTPAALQPKPMHMDGRFMLPGLPFFRTGKPVENADGLPLLSAVLRLFKTALLHLCLLYTSRCV